ncbi:50S ribosomal protein L13 [Candidatus Micrarchaeota archaeon]|nr:50S ribosomal protein L13 [Candidatus Micrarchaeota archaeon]
MMIVIDGSGLLLGRMSSQVAKKLLEGEEIHIINAEKLVMVGNPAQIKKRYLHKRSLKNKASPERSPKWSKIPHLLVKKMISGMLPKKCARGKAALKKLRVHTGNPKKMEQNHKIEKASFDGLSKHIVIGDLCKGIGYSG